MPGFTRGRHKVPADERDKQERHSGHEDRAAVSSRAAPVASLLFVPDARPGIDGLRPCPSADGLSRSVTRMRPVAGPRSLCDGLTFDCCGLAPAKAGEVQGGMQLIGLPRDLPRALAQVTLAPDLIWPDREPATGRQDPVRACHGIGADAGGQGRDLAPAQIAIARNGSSRRLGSGLKAVRFPHWH
jgi:hypothetical protein